MHEKFPDTYKFSKFGAPLLNKLLREWNKGHGYEPKNLAELIQGVLE
jgi:hypothetical protein